MAVNEDFKLARLMQTLPQELYDKIYDLTFTASQGERQICNDHAAGDWPYLDSAVQNILNFRLLHVDRSSRKMYIDSFFVQATAQDIFTFQCTSSAQGFLRTMEPVSTKLVETLRVPSKQSWNGKGLYILLK